MKIKELKEWARKEGIKGYSQMSKDELQELWKNHNLNCQEKYIILFINNHLLFSTLQNLN